MIRRLLLSGNWIESGAIHDENIRPAVVVIIENRNASSRRFDDVFLRVHTPENIRSSETALHHFVGEIRSAIICGDFFLGDSEERIQCDRNGNCRNEWAV